MTNVALIFPGQGTQAAGMGKNFYDSSDEAKQIFDDADAILKNGLTDVVFNGPAEKLTSTAYCQPAILTMSVAALKVFETSEKFKNISVRYTAGLSLGEYAALVACGALSFENTLRLVERRSTFMEEATKLSRGKMAAIIGLDKEVIVKVCEETGAQVANFNSPQQIVITGHAEKVEAACQKLSAAGAKSVVPLDVSGGFHSSLMKPAADKFVHELANVDIASPRCPIISNINAQPTSDPAAIRGNLAKQITGSVQWVDTINFIAKQGVENFIEIGPGKVLKGLLRRINPQLKVYNIENPADIDALPF